MGHMFGSHERSRRLRSVFTALFAVTALTLAVGIQAALASHPEVSLAGSNFEIDTDANLKLDDAAPSIDWASVTEIRKTDTQSGNNDESFGQGTKENTAVPSVVDGGIPPNKSDLKAFGVYQEGSGSTGFLNLFWSRVQDPSGTTNMDFEFNKNQCPGAGCSANGVTPIRSTGDILVIYDLSQGGTHPTLSIRRWTAGGVWGPATELADAVDAAGSINTSPILAADSDGLGAQDPRTFGEAQLDLSVIFQGSTGCTSFGSAYLKSRSSDSFTAALKDFVPPVGISITNCGTVNIHKQNDVGTALAGAEFTLFTDNAPLGGSAPHGAEDTATTLKCTTTASGNCSISSVPFGKYWAVETVTPSGHSSAADQYVDLSASTPNLTISLTFVNARQRGAIKVTKLVKVPDSAGDQPMAGVTITVNGVPKVTDANGQVCFDNLLFGSYTVTETVPTGYHAGAGQGTSVLVNNAATCTDATYVGETHTIHNIPLTDLTVSVTPQVAGATKSKITCTGLTPTPTDTTPGGFDDTSETVVGLEPGEYTCIVVIDP